ncbi:MAG: hypothetical protein KAS47_03120 [Candidatus Heimdallarchaeota archaeon]|nr:hypothetical protein [Candidatus Heimdallarchaeota archaeon]MCK4973196.1 hypothetical protein [Candidatus Heimdallarchaeota archaeon]
MKKFQFLALKSEEFFDMISMISRERNTLRRGKRTDNVMKIICFMVIPASIITFKVKEENSRLNVTRTINFLPILLLSIPILAALEAIVYGISTLVNTFSALTFILVGSAWIVVVMFLIYQTFVEADEINKRLYRVEL